MPSSVLWVIETTPGWAWCSTPIRWASSSICSGRSLPSGAGRSISLAPRIRSGAPVSSVAMWAPSVHTTASAGPSSVASASTLAPVPLNVSSVVTSPNSSRNAPSHSFVQASSP